MGQIGADRGRSAGSSVTPTSASVYTTALHDSYNEKNIWTNIITELRLVTEFWKLPLRLSLTNCEITNSYPTGVSLKSFHITIYIYIFFWDGTLVSSSPILFLILKTWAPKIIYFYE